MERYGLKSLDFSDISGNVHQRVVEGVLRRGYVEVPSNGKGRQSAKNEAKGQYPSCRRARSKKRKKGRLRRRVYNVQGPNHLWHVDTNHKLVRWNFIIVGGIDGFS